MAIYRKLRKLSGKRLPRRFHCYCIGAAKTATTAVSAMFEQHYDAAHEADIAATNRTLIHYLEGGLEDASLRDYLLARDRRFRLELESTHSLIYAAPQLVDLFPESLYLITIREPYAWLRSRLNFHFKKDPPEWREYRHYFWDQLAGEHAVEEAILKEHGICPLDVYLQQYADHYERVFNHIPASRRLVIKTNELTARIPDIANFLNIAPTSLPVRRANTEDEKAPFVDQLDTEFVKATISRHCRPLIEEFFPERLSFYGIEAQA